MKKLQLLAAAALLAAGTSAQVPREMDYSVMVLRPGSGQVVQQKDVALRLELRQESADGKAVWGKDYQTTTDANGLCQLRLDLSTAAIDWDKGPYFMALIVDGEEAGAAKFASVPYALNAARIEGVPTRQELVGTWRATETEDGDVYTYTLVLNDDGTGSFPNEADNSDYEKPHQITRWVVSGSGLLFLEKYRNGYENPKTLSIVRLSETQIAIGGDNGVSTRVYTKVN